MLKKGIVASVLFIASFHVQAQPYYSRMFDLFHAWESAGNIISYDSINESITFIGESIDITKPYPYDRLVYTASIDTLGGVVIKKLFEDKPFPTYYHVGLYDDSLYSFILKIEDTTSVNAPSHKISHVLVKLNKEGDSISSNILLLEGFVGSFIRHRGNRIYIIGTEGPYNTSPMAIACIDTAGSFLWHKVYPSNICRVVGGTFDDNGNLILSGGIYLNTSNVDSMVGWYAKIDTSGVFLWEQIQEIDAFTFSGYPYLISHSIYFLGSNPRKNQSNYNYISKIDAKGNIIWQKMVQEGVVGKYSSLVRDFSTAVYMNGYFYGVGSYYSSNDSGLSSTDEMQFVKVDTLGNIKWRRAFKQWDHDNRAWGIKAIPDGFIICGDAKDSTHTTGYSDAWIIKTDTNGCIVPGCNARDAVPQILNPSHLMKVYPNPATDEVCIDMTDARVYPQKVWVYDTTGSQMRKETFTGNQHCIDTSRLKAGTYFVVVSLSDGSQATSKVMVQH